MATLHDNDDDEQRPGTEHEDVDVENEAPAREEPEVEVIEDTADSRVSNEDNEGDDGAPEERPARQRETAAERRARAKLAKERDKRELEFQKRLIADLDKQVRALQQTQTVTRVTDLDNRIAAATTEIGQYEAIKAKAIDAKNGHDAVLSDRLQREAENKLYQAQQQREALVREASTPKPVAPAYQSMAQDFMTANPWYNHDDLNNKDTRLVRELDAEVAKEYNPLSPMYWSELQKRVAKNLPQHFQDNDDSEDEAPAARPSRKGPPVGGSTRSTSASVGTTQIRLSPERVQAMKEAGYWDDPVVRAKMAKKYNQYDKNSRG